MTVADDADSPWLSRDIPPDAFSDAPGVEEVPITPWPLLVRARSAVRRRVRPATSPWTVLAITLVGLFSVGFTITLLAVTIPTIADDLDASPATLTWVITGPTLAFGLVGPSLGKLGDLYGHKKLAVMGLLGAGLFAAATTLAWSAASLITFRILGAGVGAAVGPASIALINRTFAREDRVKALGYWSLVSAGGPVVGALVGAPVVEAVGWRVVFAVQAPLCIAAAVIALVKLPETDRGERVRFDVAGALTLAVGITALLFAMNRGGVWGWLHPAVLAGFLLTPVVLWVFVQVERRAASPLVPLHYLRRRNVAGPIAVQACSNFAYMGAFVLIPLVLQGSLGYSTTHVTLLVVARPLALSLTGPVAGYATARTGERVAGVVGVLLVASSMLVFAGIREGTSDAVVVAGLLLCGMGMGVSSPAMAASIANAVEEGDFGVAGATQQLVTQVGVAAGIQLMQTVQAAMAEPGVTGPALAASYGPAFLVGAAVCLLGLVGAAVIRPSVGRRAAAP